MSAEPSAGTTAAASSLSAMSQAPAASAASASAPPAASPKIEDGAAPPLPASVPTTPKVRRSRKKAAYRSIFSPKCVNHCSETTKIKDLCKPCSNIQDAHRKKEGRKTPLDPNRPPSAKKAAGSAVLGKRPRPAIPPPAGYSPSPAASIVPTRFALTPVTITAETSGLATDVVAEAKACRIWQLCKQYLDHHNVLSDMMPEMMAVMLGEIHECLRNHLNEIAIQKGLDAESSRMDEDADPASDHQDDTTSEPEL